MAVSRFFSLRRTRSAAAYCLSGAPSGSTTSRGTDPRQAGCSRAVRAGDREHQAQRARSHEGRRGQAIPCKRRHRDHSLSRKRPCLMTKEPAPEVRHRRTGPHRRIFSVIAKQGGRML